MGGHYGTMEDCCDLKSDLYDANGNLICHPDGGYAGTGDGKCQEFFAERKDGRQLWDDTRVTPSPTHAKPSDERCNLARHARRRAGRH